MVQWLGLHMLTAEGPGSVPGQGTKILQAMWHGQKTNSQKKKIVQNKYEGQRPKQISPRTIPQFPVSLGSMCWMQPNFLCSISSIYNKHKSSRLIVLLWKLNEVIHTECLAWCLAHDKLLTHTGYSSHDRMQDAEAQKEASLDQGSTVYR